MARNAEKSNLLLNKWVTMKEEHARNERHGGKPREERRPHLASECKSLPDAERWRRMIIGEISRKISEIQNAGLGEARLRDLNDEINKCIREKGHWERQIKALGGADHGEVSARLFEGEGREVPGGRGYRYFGAAKDLPGVRELFEEAAESATGAWRGRAELSRFLTPDYYGWRDEEDGSLVKSEKERELIWREEGLAGYKAAHHQGQQEGSEADSEGAIIKAVGVSISGEAALAATRGELEAAMKEKKRELLHKTYG